MIAITGHNARGRRGQDPRAPASCRLVEDQAEELGGPVAFMCREPSSQGGQDADANGGGLTMVGDGG